MGAAAGELLAALWWRWRGLWARGPARVAGELLAGEELGLWARLGVACSSLEESYGQFQLLD
jgi:hypothetical protein